MLKRFLTENRTIQGAFRDKLIISLYTVLI